MDVANNDMRKNNTFMIRPETLERDRQTSW